MRARLRDTELFFDIDGASLVADGARMRERPTAFLVHGGPGVDHTGMKTRYGLLAERLQLVYFDHRGNGRSGRGDPSTYSLDEHVGDMEALRQYLGLGPIVSIGTSYGGMVCMAHAARFPGSVSHLILVSTVAHCGYAERARQIVTERGTPEQLKQFEAAFSAGIETVEQLRRFYEVMGPLYGRKYDPALAKEGFHRAILTPEASNRAHALDGYLRTFDLRPELKSITAPTLILGARYDWICAPEFSEELHQLIPGSDLRIFEESGHWIGGDEPQNFLDVVAGFVVYNRGGLTK